MGHFEAEAYRTGELIQKHTSQLSSQLTEAERPISKRRFVSQITLGD